MIPGSALIIKGHEFFYMLIIIITIIIIILVPEYCFSFLNSHLSERRVAFVLVFLFFVCNLFHSFAPLLQHTRVIKQFDLSLSGERNYHFIVHPKQI